MEDERQEEPEDLDRPPSFFPYEDETLGVEPALDPGEPVEVKVEAVFAAQSGQNIQRFVLLSDGTRKLPIVIGGFEASAITYPLEGQQPDRPMTHDLMRNLLERLGGVVKQVLIDDLWGSTYYAKIVMEHNGEEMVIDSRPSDAIALAIRVDAPIFVADGILDQQGN